MSTLEDSAGQTILPYDLVQLKAPAGGAHGDRGLAVQADLAGKRLRVLCADGARVVVEARDVSVADRSQIGRGFAVTSASDPDGHPFGVVTGAATALDLLRLTDGEVVARDVSPAQLPCQRDDATLGVGSYVVSGRWLGRVVEESLDVHVLFDDGAVCRVSDAGSKLKGLPDNKVLEAGFYLGQQVVGDGSVLKASRWLKGCWKPSREVGTVAKVEASGVLVYWVASSSQAEAPPAYHQSPRDLTFFCSSDVLMPKFCPLGLHYCLLRDPAPSAPPAHGPLRRRATMRRSVKRLEELERAMCVVSNTRTTVDVVWQDGTRQRGVPSASLLPLYGLDLEHQLLPGQRVVVRRNSSSTHSDDDASEEPPRSGVVRSFDHKDLTARVSWSPTEEETVSAYHLRLSSDLDALYGDVVVRLRPDGESTQEQDMEGISWVGHVIDLCDDGQHIQVKWGDGNTSRVLPHEVAVVKPESIQDMLQELGGWLHDGDDYDSQSDDDDGEGNEDSGSSHNDGTAAPRTTMGWAGAAAQAMIRLASTVLAKSKRYMMSSSAKEAADAPRRQAGKMEADANDFPHFDVAPSPPDHHYLDDSAEQVGTTGGGRNRWIKRVQKEWKILEDNLPSTIYVRAYEDRMDLFRAVMVGASGTPYHDALFFFDLQLPPSYPAAPPLVNYRSFGLRVNPNLYESGTVCLSLLNTFGGEGPELWSPEASSVLQVLVSIQGLVLTAQPYYNEAGYSAFVGTPEGRRSEVPYSENAYLLTVQTMLHLLRRPPAGFEAFVREHFCRRGRHVLRACQAYLDGCTVGTLDDEARPTEVSRERSCSAGFRLALGNVMPRLLQMFKEIGADGFE